MSDSKSVKVYKYYSLGDDIDNDYNIDALKKGYWYFGTPEYRNDPFDCCIGIYKSIIGRELNREEEAWVKKFGACSFTKKLDNLHLWSLYANSHTGFVLEFEISEEDYFDLTSKNINIPIFDIMYLDLIPNLEDINYNELQKQRYFAVDLQEMTLERRCQEEKELRWYLAHSIKQKKIWANEEEVRMFLGTIRPSKDIPNLFETIMGDGNIKGYKIYYPKHCLKKCIAGLSISDKNFNILKSITHQLGIPLTRMLKGSPFNISEY